MVGLLTVMIFFQSYANLQHVKLKMKKRRQFFFFGGVQSTEYYLSICKKKTFQDLVKFSCNTRIFRMLLIGLSITSSL